jgi:hypothetical protein
MAEVSSIITQLKVERDRVAKQLLGMDAALRAFIGVYEGGAKGTRQISAAGRKRIAVAQRERWAKQKGSAEVPKKRTMSASARRKIAAAQRARWAKVKRGQKAA